MKNKTTLIFTRSADTINIAEIRIKRLCLKDELFVEKAKARAILTSVLFSYTKYNIK